jgi:hypothetical protein
MRFRNPGEDCLRLGGTERVIIDHVSLENAGDESIELSRSHDVTIQQSVIAEPVGDHYRWGGILINYSKDQFPQDNLSIHHNVWNGSYGRLPEFSCEENGDGPGTTNCAGRTLRVELTNNVMFDVYDSIYYNRCVGLGGGNDCGASTRDYHLAINFVGNVMMRRTAYGSIPMFIPDVSRTTRNQAFYADNIMFVGSTSRGAGMTIPSRSARFDYPPITTQAASGLTAALQRTAGAFPRDPMDTRLMGYLSGSVEARPPAWSGGGIDRGDGFRTNTPAFSPPTDTDNDGMPDDFERTNMLNPAVQDHNGTALSMRFTGVAGYTNLECYLNSLSDERVRTGR